MNAASLPGPAFAGGDDARLDGAQLSRLMPMHLRIAPDGRILSAGPTMRKVLPADARRLGDAFALTRPLSQADDLDTLASAAEDDSRVFLRMTQPPGLTLRGHVVRLAGGVMLLDLGFGIGLPDAVRDLTLTDGDFAPSGLAMELLFLHEANRSVMNELSRFNLRLEEAREAAELQAFTDPLTGLYNRRGMDLALAVALRGAEAEGTSGGRGGFALAHLDLDHFKEVNDRLGHAAGDEVLRHVARILRRETRANDTIARVGGDEFVLILAGMVSDDALDGLARRVIAGIERPLDLDGRPCRVSASMGIAMSAHYDAPDAETMMADADAALYRSKNAGRGRATMHHDMSGPIAP